MYFVFGGRGMGQLEYAESLLPDAKICDLADSGEEELFSADIVVNVHLFVRRLLAQGGNPVAFFQYNMEKLTGKIIIGDEVGSGVVPNDPLERQWRDETGRVYQLLSRSATRITRLWAGIPQELKSEADR